MLLHVVVAASLAGSLTVGTAVPAQATPTQVDERNEAADDHELRALLVDDSDGRARFTTNPDTGATTFIGATSAHPLMDARGGGVATANAFLGTYAPLFGSDPTSSELEVISATDGPGAAAIRYQQTIGARPVLAGHIAVQIDGSGAVVSATGETASAIPQDLDTTATIDAAVATATALAVTVRAGAADGRDLSTSVPELWIYDPTLIGAPSIGTRLVWRIEVRTSMGDVDRLLLVDAHDGSVVLDFSQRAEALDRLVCDNANDDSQPTRCGGPLNPADRSEGDGPTGLSDVDTAFEFSGDVYDFYDQVLGRDSLDDNGMTLRSTVRFCDPADVCPYDNAFWNGEQMVYGQGFADGDDVVGHELTHGVTELTSGLLYFSESGAINESLSDVFGELIDLWNGADASADRWLVGEDLPIGAIRDMEVPGAFGDPDRMTSPAFHGSLSDSRGVHINSGVNNKAAFLITDGGAFNGQTVVGLGIEKAARIYYEAQTTLLTPGSDYRDLGVILPQACSNLIGTNGISASDCQQVVAAITATEMHLRPTASGANLSAPICASGIQNGVMFTDDMEVTNPAWESSVIEGGAHWGYTSQSSQSGSRSLHVLDDSAPLGVSTLTLATPISLPAGSTPFLRFDHAFMTDWDSGDLYDGGVVEVSINGGASWADITAIGTMVNGYNDVIESAAFGGQVNALAGRSAFGSISPSYQTTRIPLAVLAGQTIRLRFRFATDNYPNLVFPGWFIDDVSVYTCGNAQAPGPPRAAAATPGTTGGTATVSWLPPISDGGSALVAYVVTPVTSGNAGPSIVLPAGTTTTTVPGLVPGASVTFSIAAQNALGASAPALTNAIVVPGTPVTPFASIIAAGPSRVLDTRPGFATLDGLFSGIGLRSGGSVTAVTVAGRLGVPGDAEAVALNVTVTDARDAGFLTVYPCGGEVPTASNLNYVTGATVPNLVVARVGAAGQVCLFTQSDVHVVADLNGYVPAGSSFRTTTPARVYESRVGLATADGQQNGTGLRPAGTVTEIALAGRVGVLDAASTISLNVTVTEPEAAGFLTVYPCGTGLPTASNLNYVAGATVPNAVVTQIGAGGKVCIFNQAPLHLVVDVNGYALSTSGLVPMTPARLLETRAGLSTVDGTLNAVGRRGAGSIIEVQVAGRAGVPVTAEAVILNATVTETDSPGFATVYPCTATPPNASNLNYGAGTTVANAVVTRLSPTGSVCVVTQSATHLVLDVAAYVP